MPRHLTTLRDFLSLLRDGQQLVEIDALVDPALELAEIHRRVIAAGGPAILFKNVKGSPFPVVTNLFGTRARVEIAFGATAKSLTAQLARLPTDLFPPSLGKLWKERKLLAQLCRVGTSRTRQAPVLAQEQSPVALGTLPMITSWKEDGGPFMTLPLIYTEHPTTGVSNLGLYRMQRFDDTQTGIHWQIGKGGGFHYSVAEALNRPLPMHVFLGGPPALMLGAMAPLPENVPELLLASLLQGEKMQVAAIDGSPLPILAQAEFALVGNVAPHLRRPEGPFGDHYGYYSLMHDYPVFNCRRLYHRRDAIYPATVVGKPRQEDFYLGNFVQELLSPFFPLAMPGVDALWSYGETGFHSLSAAVVKNRYKREAMASAFRILGEGQLSLTKFLLLLDRPLDLRDFKSVLTHVLERARFETDLFIFGNLSMDTLDYTGPHINEGSKGVLLGIGDPIRTLPRELSGELPRYIRNAIVFSPGCLAVEAATYAEQPAISQEIANHDWAQAWPLIVVVDNAKHATTSTTHFLWTTFTRFEPAADLYSSKREFVRNCPSFSPPIVIDARMKPSYPASLVCDDDTARLVDRRWREYFPTTTVEMGDSNQHL